MLYVQYMLVSTQLQAGTLQGERNGSDVDSLSKRLEELREYVGFVECCCQDACERARLRASGRSKQLCVELESGGNIKFIDGDPSLSWYKSCCNLVNSRYSVTESLREVGEATSQMYLVFILIPY